MNKAHMQLGLQFLWTKEAQILAKIIAYHIS
jgi:hypothetical protein